jgi:hypothetical protein
MSEQRIVRFYLEDGLRDSAAQGRHNFIGLIARVVAEAGYDVEFRADTPAERLAAPTRSGYALFHMSPPTHDRALSFRRVYHYPFWAIERSDRRWDWLVARASFDPPEHPGKQALRFRDFWRHRLFGDAPATARRDGLVYVPLQGRLLEHRSFQTCSPIEMLQHVLDHDPHRTVVATLHPSETYSRAEHDALAALGAAHPRLTLTTGQMTDLLRRCDYVVTQNSSAAFNGYFFGKPAILFARIDFHHIAANVADLGVAGALRAGPDLAPDYASYLHWFWQQMAINAGRPEAPERIRAALVRAGWQV